MAEDMSFSIESFIEGLSKSCEKQSTNRSNKLKKVLMNTKDNLGTITISPFISKSIGNFFISIERVREFYTTTTLLEVGEAWYKILPVEAYGQLTEDQKKLYEEVIGLYDHLRDKGSYDYSSMRTRSYSLFLGYCINQVDIEGNPITDNLDTPCLLVYPSLSPKFAMNEAIANKKTIYKDKTVIWLQKIITTELKGRSGVLSISFKKGSIGYDSSVNFEINSEFSEVIKPDLVFSKEIESEFDDPLVNFLGWMYDADNKSYFNETAFRELKTILEIEIKKLDQPTESPIIENNANGDIDPMLKVPGVDKPELPF